LVFVANINNELTNIMADNPKILIVFFMIPPFNVGKLRIILN